MDASPQIEYTSHSSLKRRSNMEWIRSKYWINISVSLTDRLDCDKQGDWQQNEEQARESHTEALELLDGSIEYLLISYRGLKQTFLFRHYYQLYSLNFKSRMGKKGLSLEDKRQKILELYYERVSLMPTLISIERGVQSEGDREVWGQERSR